MKRFFILALLSSLSFAAHATAYIQNEISDQPISVQYQYCQDGQTCGAVITANDIEPHTAFTVPASANPADNFVHIVSASTPDGWNYANLYPNSTCDSWTIDTPEFSNISKSYVQNVLQCSHSVGAKAK